MMAPLWLTLKLAFVSTLGLFLIGVPLAWWLAKKSDPLRTFVGTLVSLPLVLPPTVLGFYLLLLLGQDGPIGALTQKWGWGVLAFSFPGLVIGSILYSLPFVVQPLQNGFESLKQVHFHAAATLGASPWDRFCSLALPLTRSHFVSAAILGFAHTLGEFGVVLMIGGNIPGKTRVLSIAIYDAVETLQFEKAHWLSAGVLTLSFLLLYAASLLRKRLSYF